MLDNTLTIFYDGNCPLCCAEMDKLKHYDSENNLVLIDLHQKNFNAQFPLINVDKAMAILHGVYHGEILLGLDVTHRAWTIVGKGAWVAPLQLPIIKQFSNIAYRLLAKYRHPISDCLHKRFGVGVKTCDKGTCYDKSSNVNHRG
jgi:predicted DCC family thiol-disulfide oxidoreductase YuxK